MKTKSILFAMLAIAAVSFSGCTTTTTATPSDSTRPVITTEKRVYSKEELDKRGRQTPGEDLAAQDASITYTGRH